MEKAEPMVWLVAASAVLSGARTGIIREGDVVTLNHRVGEVVQRCGADVWRVEGAESMRLFVREFVGDAVTRGLILIPQADALRHLLWVTYGRVEAK